MEASGCLLQTQTPGPRCKGMAENRSSNLLAMRPKDGFVLDAASGVIDATHGVGERDRDVSSRDELELLALLYAVGSGTRLGG